MTTTSHPVGPVAYEPDHPRRCCQQVAWRRSAHGYWVCSTCNPDPDELRRAWDRPLAEARARRERERE